MKSRNDWILIRDIKVIRNVYNYTYTFKVLNELYYIMTDDELELYLTSDE